MDIWQVIESALELPPAERDDHLVETLDGQDLEHAREVLERAADADHWFARMGRELDDARSSELLEHEVRQADSPQRVGTYRLLERVGAGGMGEVFRAQRDDGSFDQTVAVKVLRRSLGDPLSRERFRTERQILARLDHPNIARLIDGGVTQDGRPWLAMEWVEGQRIDRWVHQRQLTIRQRVLLFLDVCDALAHAHRNLIVHRDLKPSNIMVDGNGRARLLDFGIAKLLSEPEIPSAPRPAPELEGAHTLPGSLPLTPRYAAPEQLAGEPITTATDIYGLGMVFYELLTGEVPSPSEVEAATSSLPSATRKLEAKVRRQLRGDLDAIVTAALTRDPADRTRSAESLRADLEAWLQHRPVSVRKPSIPYRLSRFLRRQRVTVITAAVGLLVLTLVGVRLLEQHRATVTERDKAQAVSTLLVDLFRSADPLQPQRSPPTASTVLARGLERVRELDQDPDLQASLADVLGEVHRNVGLHSDAVDLHRQAATTHLARGRLSEHARSLALQADALRLDGQLEEARVIAEQGLALTLERHGVRSPEAANVRSLLGRILLSQRQLDSAQEQFELALELQRLTAEGPTIDLATTLNDLAATHLLRGAFDRAEPLFREAIDIRREELGAAHPSITGIENNLAAVLSRQLRLEEAEAVYRRLLPAMAERLGERHLHSINARRNLGLVLLQRGLEAEALNHLTTAFEASSATLAADHPQNISLLNYIGFTHTELGNFGPAEQSLLTSLDQARDAYSADDPRLGGILNNLGQLAERLGDLTIARRRYEEAAETSSARLPEGHPQLLTIHSNLARVAVLQGQVQEAGALLAATLESQRSVLDARHPDLAYSLVTLARLRMSQQQAEAADEALDEALTIRRAILPPGHRLIEEVTQLRDEVKG